ncbi:Cellobiose dehydrogenase protein [Rutstroemia sp. NJR-2017a BBW]|nr:Cellobiose dehydrogenase protein [Rutstroemia sp. NJR-2017a BBW]
MPAHKGIKLSIISQWELKVHLEFPHPETTQFTYRAHDGDEGTLSEGSNTSPTAKSSDSKADRLLGRQSSIISVYIPSVSGKFLASTQTEITTNMAAGARFFVRYNVIDAVAESKWYYFKLFMNGRHITSWGSNSRTRPSGQVMRAFFEPDEKYDYTEGKKIFRSPGTEQRSFFFTEEKEGTGAAEDGGLIEVQVFRARGRKKRAQHVEEFKDQSQWGIGSWDNLVTLNLIPPNHPRSLVRQVPSMMRLPTTDTEKPEAGTPKKYLGKLYTSDQIHDAVRVAYHDEYSSESSDDTRVWIPRPLDSTPQESSKKRDNRDAVIVPHECEQSCPLPSTCSAPLAHEVAQSQDWLANAYIRPLPEVPSRNSSVSHSRPSSAASRAPSVTPSLVSYLERDQTSPEPYVGDAIAVSIDDPGDASDEDVVSSHKRTSRKPNGSAKPSSNGRRQISLIPTSFSLPNVTFRKSKKSPQKPLSIRVSTRYSSALKIDNGSPATDDDADTHTGTLSITESEWMCRTPSPVRNDPEYSYIERKLWSPGVDLEDKHRSHVQREVDRDTHAKRKS